MKQTLLGVGAAATLGAHFALAPKVHGVSVVALFGATGGTGRRVLTRLVAAGHQVRVLVRDPARLPSVDGVVVVVGDVLDPAAVGETVAGSGWMPAPKSRATTWPTSSSPNSTISGSPVACRS